MSQPVSFNPVPGTVFDTRGNGVAYDGSSRWVAVGAVGSNNTIDILTSTNGRTWSTVTGDNFGNTQGYAVAYGGGRWVAGGEALGDGTTTLTSTNGTSWSLVTGVTMSNFLYGVAYGGGRWVAVGDDTDGGNRTIQTSTNGTSWTTVTGTIFTSTGRGVAYDGSGRWVAVGDNGGGGNTILTSTNGTSWSAVSGTVFTNYGLSVAYGNGLWVAGGSGTNKILTSTNGTTWTANATGTIFSTECNGIAYGNGRWIAVGSGGNTILTSTNGLAWTTPTGATTFSSAGNGIAYGSQQWIAVGYEGGGGNTILYSSDVPCFLEGTKILTDKGYVSIEKIRKGHMVKTATSGLVPVEAVGVRTINHNCSSERIGEQLYVCSTEKYPELFEDLVITGHHSLLVKEFANKEQRAATEKALGAIYATENYYRLPACVDDRADVYPEKGEFKIYHLALENKDYYMNYGVYANGLLVETTSKRYILELSGMTLLE